MSNSPAQPWRGRCFFTTRVGKHPTRRSTRHNSNTPPPPQSQQNSHSNSRTSQSHRLNTQRRRTTPDSCIAGCPNEVVLPADDTRAVPQRQTIGLLRQRGADADGVAALLEAASKGTLDRRCSGDVCGVRSPFRKGLRKSAGAGMTASRVVGTSPVGRDRRQHTKTLWWQPDAPARTTRLLSALAAGHHTHRVSCRLVTALLRAFCCAGQPGSRVFSTRRRALFGAAGRVLNSEAPDPIAPTRALTVLDTTRVARVDVWLRLALWNHNRKP